MGGAKIQQESNMSECGVARAEMESNIAEKTQKSSPFLIECSNTQNLWGCKNADKVST